MGTKVTKKLFERAVSEEVNKLFAPLGFVEVESGVFDRQCGKVVHGFGFTPNASFTHFHVPVGTYVPALDERTDYIDFGGGHYPTLVVSRWLGEFKANPKERQVHYHFATVEELRTKFPQVYADFLEQAEPWLARLVTVDDVAEEFYKWRIAPPSPKETRPPDSFAWAQYGWLLQEAGRKAEARPWLERALEQLKQPTFYTKGGHFVPIGTPGAKAMQRRPEERRLEELLLKDLGCV